ncbi:MAG: hypothetical protein AB7Q81_24270 [Gammaproteobacteria bacterium]
MAARTSPAQRIQMENVAERELHRYAGNHALWHKHVHDVELDPAQVLKMVEMDQHRMTLDYSCRRTGKTAVKELYLIEQNALESDQELGIVAPREAQAIVNLNYHLEAIRRSPILSAYIAFKSGRRQIADTYYQFANRSLARAYGIMAQVDGGDLTMASLEEVDDMPRERLFSRFLLMMGSKRRLGASKDSANDPQIRITGVFKGADTLSDMVNDGHYHVLPTVNVHLGIEMGILNEDFMTLMRTQLSPDEYIRQLLCINVAARNLIWEKYVRRAMHIGLQASLGLAEPLPGEQYKKRGLIGLGYDHSGHGESPQASRYACVVTEQIGNFTCFVFARTWPPGTDEQVVRRDLLGIFLYFRPDYAMGDAYGIGLMTQLNDDLYAAGVTHVDRRTIGEGESTASTWVDWFFAPIRFEGMVKHSMASALRGVFHNLQAAVPYFDDADLQAPETADLRLLVRQLVNIRPEATKASYATYKMVNAKLGDDLFDAAMAAVWALVTRGAAPSDSAVLIGSPRTREQLLGAPAAERAFS